jgi:predicted Zn-dependent peptidase
MEIYRKTVLDNGIRIVTEELPALKSVSAGLWITTGSRDEGADENGLAHFIEHLVFKGTERRSALEISRDIESVGGSINAFTGKEETCIYARVLHDDIALAIDVLADIFANSVCDSTEIERERSVVLQEIKMIEDTPDELVHDLFNRQFWGENSLGFPISGTLENVQGFERDQIVKFLHRHYTPDNLVVAAAGALDHDHVVNSVSAALGHMGNPAARQSRKTVDSWHRDVNVVHRDLEQVHCCLGMRGVPYGHRLRYAAHILNTLWGGNMSSRLFQEIREKRGLSYNIFSFLNAHEDVGCFGVYAGCMPDAVWDVIDLSLGELRDISQGTLSRDEFEGTKAFLKGSLVLWQESSEGRMSRLARNEVRWGRHIPLEESLDRLDKVSMRDVIGVAEEMSDPATLCVTILGNLDGPAPCADRWVVLR